jgi:hypothetical protein
MENSIKKEKTEDLKDKLDSFIGNKSDNEKCEGDECFIKQPQDVIERVEKKYITNDGRQLLI